jgi:hypothetical protein
MRCSIMLRSKPSVRSAFIFGSALLLAAGGCGNGRPSSPSDEVARAALDAALKTWRDGGKPGAVAGMDPPVQVHDTPWARGDRLASYEILGEEAGAAAAEKQFTVRLVLAGKPERTEEVTYHVLGRGPVMVFRDEDYKRNINMEEGPKLEKPGSRTRRRG